MLIVADAAVCGVWKSVTYQETDGLNSYAVHDRARLCARRGPALLFPAQNGENLSLLFGCGIFYFIFLLEMIGEVACILHQPGETNNTIYNESQPSQPERLAHRFPLSLAR